MKSIVALLLLLVLNTCLAADEGEVTGDINCDGKIDSAKIVQTKEKVTLYVTLNDGTKTNELSFGLGHPDRQDSLCGTEVVLKKEAGTKNNCIGLNISDSMCDSMHIFWNPKTKQINWRRL